MMDNSTRSANSSFELRRYDYQSDTLSPEWRAAVALLLLTVYAVVLALNWGIAHYEREAPDKYRTVVNKLVALSSYYNIAWSTATLPLVALLYAFFTEGLNQFVCGSCQLVALANNLMVILTYNEIMLLRCVYIRLGTIGGMKEDFVFSFLLWINLILGLVTASWLMVLTRSAFLLYHFCLGSFQEPPDLSQIFPFLLMLFLLTILNFIVTKWKLRKNNKLLEKKRIRVLFKNRRVGPQPLEASVSIFVVTSKQGRAKERKSEGTQPNDDKESMLDGKIIAMVILVMNGALFVLGLIMLKREESAQDNIYLRILGMVMWYTLMPIMIYARKPQVRKFLKRELLNKIK